MTTIDSHKNRIRDLQEDSIHRTREILRIIDESQNAGSKSLELLDKQYEQMQKINKNTETINHNLEVSSGILGRIKYFFFPRKATKIEKFSKDLVIDDDNNNNIDVPENLENNSRRKRVNTKIKSEFVDESLENELDNNLDDINDGVATLKNMALTMNSALVRDKELLDKVHTKSEIVNSNIKKMNKEITKVL
jgi:hypothetical protein